MQNATNKYWYILWGSFAALIGVLALVFDEYPQFPSMCIILGIILGIMIDTMDPIPPANTYHWHQIWDEVRGQKIPIWKGFLFMQSKIVFPTLFTIYLILLIIQKVKLIPTDWQSYAAATIDTLQLLWVTLISAVLANFTGLDEKNYITTHHSPTKNSLTLILVCLLSYGGMWAIFSEIASIGRTAFFVSLSVGTLIGLVSMMILVEDENSNI